MTAIGGYTGGVRVNLMLVCSYIITAAQCSSRGIHRVAIGCLSGHVSHRDLTCTYPAVPELKELMVATIIRNQHISSLCPSAQSRRVLYNGMPAAFGQMATQMAVPDLAFGTATKPRAEDEIRGRPMKGERQ